MFFVLNFLTDNMSYSIRSNSFLWADVEISGGECKSS